MVNLRLQQKHLIFLKRPEPLSGRFACTLIKIICIYVHIVQSVYECKSMHACVRASFYISWERVREVLVWCLCGNDES